MLPVKKIYVDTKYRTANSVSSSNFKYELPYSVTLPEHTAFYLTDFACPHSWYTIESGVNDKLYLTLHGDGNPALALECYIVTITSGNYDGASLAVEIETRIQLVIGQTWITTSFNVVLQQLTIYMSLTDTTFKILTRNDIKTQLNGTWNGTSYNVNDPNDICDILSQTETNSSMYSSTSPFVSGYLDLQPIKNIYISSPNLGSYTTIGPTGQQTIIKKVPVSADFGYVIFDELMPTNDYLDCSRQSLKTIEFLFRDVNNNTINLHGANLSFSIVFDIQNPDI